MGDKMRYSSEKPVVDHGEMMIYQTEDGLTKIDVSLRDETVWLLLNQMSELFQKNKSTISRHIKNIFNEGELEKNSVVANFATTAADGKTYHVNYYNLDIIISVGYRVKSIRGTQFRIWATSVIKEYMIKGFAKEDERLKGNGGGTYWKEMLTDAGKISHDQAMRKAKEEYRKFQQAALTPVDKAYLNSLKAIGKKAEKRVKER